MNYKAYYTSVKILKCLILNRLTHFLIPFLYKYKIENKDTMISHIFPNNTLNFGQV